MCWVFLWGVGMGFRSSGVFECFRGCGLRVQGSVPVAGQDGAELLLQPVASLYGSCLTDWTSQRAQYPLIRGYTLIHVGILSPEYDVRCVP